MNNIRLKYITNINSIFKMNEFILCALNLAFLCFFSNNKISNHKNLVMWSDGIYGKFLTGAKKIPGSNLIKAMRLPKDIKRIIVIGNLKLKEEKFLKKKFKVKVQHKKLPIAKVEELKKKIIINYNKTDLIFITLPTPMQENIANYLSKRFRIKKIICIGGGLAIAAGTIAECPRVLSKIGMEFIWRLRTDTARRLKRLIYTFFIYQYMKLFSHSKQLRLVKI